LGPSSSAGSASDPINVDIANNKRTDRAGGSGIELLESENTQEQLRTGQRNGEETSWLARCTAMTNFEVTAEEIADKEIGLWKLRTVPLPKTDDPLMEWKLCGDKNVCPFLGRLARRVLAVPATSASPERLFSTAGNQMTKKRCGLTCDNLETLVYLC
jgi:hypothetical protein